METGEKKDGILKKKYLIIAAAIIVVAVIAVFSAILIKNGGRIRATTMRMLRMEGTVTLEENGKFKTIIDNLRLKSGDALNTEVESLASISLDETKVITMDELSRAEFNQKRKMLDLNLTKGSLFFEVSKPLEDDETFDIRTSTMVVGIRGTSGYVTVDNENRWNIVVTDGTVHVTGINPNTGETIETDVPAGQRCTVYLYDRDEKSVLFTLEEVKEDEIPDFVVNILRDDSELLEKVVNDTDWSEPAILRIETVKEEPQDIKEAVPETEEEETETETEEEPVVEVKKDNSESRVKELIAAENEDNTFLLIDGTVFDPEFYAKMNPEIAALLGNDKYALLEYYLKYGKAGGHSANQEEENKKLAALQPEEEEETEESKESEEPDNSTSNVVMGFSVSNGVVSYNGTPIGQIAQNGDLQITAQGTYTLPITIGNTTYNASDIETFSMPTGTILNDSSMNSSDVQARVGNSANVITINGANMSVTGSSTTGLEGNPRTGQGILDMIGSTGITYKLGGKEMRLVDNGTSIEVYENGNSTPSYNSLSSNSQYMNAHSDYASFRDQSGTGTGSYSIYTNGTIVHNP